MPHTYTTTIDNRIVSCTRTTAKQPKKPILFNNERAMRVPRERNTNEYTQNKRKAYIKNDKSVNDKCRPGE